MPHVPNHKKDELSVLDALELQDNFVFDEFYDDEWEDDDTATDEYDNTISHDDTNVEDEHIEIEYDDEVHTQPNDEFDVSQTMLQMALSFNPVNPTNGDVPSFNGIREEGGVEIGMPKWNYPAGKNPNYDDNPVLGEILKHTNNATYNEDGSMNGDKYIPFCGAGWEYTYHKLKEQMEAEGVTIDFDTWKKFKGSTNSNATIYKQIAQGLPNEVFSVDDGDFKIRHKSSHYNIYASKSNPKTPNDLSHITDVTGAYPVSKSFKSNLKIQEGYLINGPNTGDKLKRLAKYQGSMFAHGCSNALGDRDYYCSGHVGMVLGLINWKDGERGTDGDYSNARILTLEFNTSLDNDNNSSTGRTLALVKRPIMFFGSSRQFNGNGYHHQDQVAFVDISQCYGGFTTGDPEGNQKMSIGAPEKWMHNYKGIDEDSNEHELQMSYFTPKFCNRSSSLAPVDPDIDVDEAEGCIGGCSENEHCEDAFCVCNDGYILDEDDTSDTFGFCIEAPTSTSDGNNDDSDDGSDDNGDDDDDEETVPVWRDMDCPDFADYHRSWTDQGLQALQAFHRSLSRSDQSAYEHKMRNCEDHID